MMPAGSCALKAVLAVHSCHQTFIRAHCDDACIPPGGENMSKYRAKFLLLYVSTQHNIVSSIRVSPAYSQNPTNKKRKDYAFRVVSGQACSMELHGEPMGGEHTKGYEQHSHRNSRGHKAATVNFYPYAGPASA